MSIAHNCTINSLSESFPFRQSVHDVLKVTLKENCAKSCLHLFGLVLFHCYIINRSCLQSFMFGQAGIRWGEPHSTAVSFKHSWAGGMNVKYHSMVTVISQQWLLGVWQLHLLLSCRHASQKAWVIFCIFVGIAYESFIPKYVSVVVVA